MGSPLCAEHRTLSLSPQRGLKNAKQLFLSSIALWLKKACYRAFCVKTVSDTVLGHTLAWLSARKWLVGDVALNVNFALSKILFGVAAVLWRIVTNALFESQLLQWNIKLLIMFINWINWCVLMHYMIAIKTDKYWRCTLCVYSTWRKLPVGRSVVATGR